MLPRLLPMLAMPARPFDDPAYLFEIKWDEAIRAASNEELVDTYIVSRSTVS
jgi:hypothetical protein